MRAQSSRAGFVGLAGQTFSGTGDVHRRSSVLIVTSGVRCRCSVSNVIESEMHGQDDVSRRARPSTDFPLQFQSPAELDRLINHYRRLIQSHRWEVRVGSAEMAGHALTAIDDIKVLLRELMDAATPEQRAKIEDILRQT
jgi:hypothetical protein